MKAAQHQRLLAASLAIMRALLLLAVMLLWPENRVWAFAPAPHLASAETSHANPFHRQGNPAARGRACVGVLCCGHGRSDIAPSVRPRLTVSFDDLDFAE